MEFCNPNQDQIITLPPTYGMYDVIAKTNSIENIEIPLKSDFSIDTDKILGLKPSNAKILFLCSPNNPTGNSFDINILSDLIKLPYKLYSEGPTTEDCDLITITSPLAVMKKTHQILTKKTKIDKPLLDKLKNVGFKLDYGQDNTGWQFKYLTRGGGYYFNVGASDLIAAGKIKVIQFSDILDFTNSGIKMKSDDELQIDLMITATGYKGQEYVVEILFYYRSSHSCKFLEFFKISNSNISHQVSF